MTEEEKAADESQEPVPPSEEPLVDEEPTTPPASAAAAAEPPAPAEAPAAAPAAPPPPPPPAAPVAPQAPPAAAVSSEKSRIVAGVLGILLGGLGVHKFYLGYTKEGAIMLVASIAFAAISFGTLAWVVSVVGLVEGIIYLTKSDEEFVATYVTAQKPWF